MLRKYGERTKLLKLIESAEYALEQTNNENKIDEIELHLASYKSELALIDKEVDNEIDEIERLVVASYKSQVKLDEEKHLFDKVKPYTMKNRKEFNEQRTIYLKAEERHKYNIMSLAKLLPTKLDWYEFENINLKAFMFNEYQISIDEM